MPKKKKKKKGPPKPRNWLAVHAFQRSGAGAHDANKYTRKKKHKGQSHD